MKINTTLSTILFCAILTLSLSIPPPKWAEAFSQSVFVQFNDDAGTATTGMYWYDSLYGAQRYDFLNGQSKFACGVVYPLNTSCSILTTGEQLYIILPEKNLCCKGGPSEIVDRNWL
jgi:hypothetical protein